MSDKTRAKLNEDLLSAVKKGNIDDVERCIRKKADINFEGTSSL